MSVEQFADNSLSPPVRGFLHLPDVSPKGGFVLTHGAGGNCQGPLLVALSDALMGAGFAVLRCNLPFRQQRSFGPPRPAEAENDRQGLASAISAIRRFSAGPLYLGGHSYGGRQASMLCAENPDLVRGLLLMSYPLHPPGRPQQLRTQHLPNLRIPVLFVHGSHDPFGSVEELQTALKLIPAETRLLVVESAGHELGFRGKSRREELPQRIAAEFQEFLSV